MRTVFANVVREAIRNDAFRRELMARPEVVGKRWGLSTEEIEELKLLDPEKLDQLAEMISTDGANKL